MTPRTRITVLAAALLLGGLLGYLATRAPGNPPAGGRSGAEGAAPPTPQDPMAGGTSLATSPPPPSAAPPARPRTPVPRPPQAPVTTPTTENPRPPERVPATEMASALRTVVEEQVKDSIAACLDLWSEVNPDLRGKVDLEFHLGRDGLSAVSILDHSDVPLGPLSCFSGAIWDAEWPVPADGGELTVTYPFVFDTRAPG